MELAKNVEGGLLVDRPAVVDGDVADLSDDVGLGEDLRPDRGIEARIAEARVEVGLVGQGETFEVEYDDDDKLDYSTGVKRS